MAHQRYKSLKKIYERFFVSNSRHRLYSHVTVVLLEARDKKNEKETADQQSINYPKAWLTQRYKTL
jgi:hypothetical protein